MLILLVRNNYTMYGSIVARLEFYWHELSILKFDVEVYLLLVHDKLHLILQLSSSVICMLL